MRRIGQQRTNLRGYEDLLRLTLRLTKSCSKGDSRITTSIDSIGIEINRGWQYLKSTKYEMMVKCQQEWSVRDSNDEMVHHGSLAIIDKRLNAEVCADRDK